MVNRLFDGTWLTHHFAPYWVELHGCIVGDPIGGGDEALEMLREFNFVGNTLQFSETYVPTVEAFPQTHHVVLHNDGTGVYTGSITARYDFPGSAAGVTRMDVIQFTVTASDGIVTDFHHNEVEYIQTNVGSSSINSPLFSFNIALPHSSQIHDSFTARKSHMVL